MQRFVKLGAVMAIAAGLAAPSHAQDVTADTVVATVGGAQITVGHLIVARGNLPEQYQTLPDDVLFNGLLDQVVQQNALAQSLGEGLPRRLRLGIENQASGYLAGEVLNQAAYVSVSDASVQAAYEAKFAAAEPEREFNAAHILFETEIEAFESKLELDKGADFANMAIEKSTGPSGPNGGALGWFSRGMMVPDFEAAVVALEPGQVSEPVKTQFGWHIIKLNETRLLEAPTLEQVRAELEQELRSVAIQNEIDRIVLESDISRIDIAIDPSVIRQTDLLDQ
ncbi:MAG: peptidyl-prolyl cis-trans isomerase C [Paracoccaceae bacterium]|jgi:peptidyl-prolyl cis-trans isomerase C